MKKIFLSIISVLSLVACNQPTDTNIQYMPFQESEKSGWGLIGTDGQVLVNDEFSQMPTVVMHDRFFSKNKNGKWELYGIEKPTNSMGEEYSQVGAFIEDVAPVVEEGKAIEFIDINGDVKFSLDRVDGKEVSTCTNFSDGVAVFRVGKYCGAINTKGDVIVDPRYVEILPANEGKMLALDKKYENDVQKGDADKIQYTILSTNGQELGTISTRRFKVASRCFVSGALVVTDESGNGTVRTGLIDEKGDWIIKPSDKIKSIKSIKNKKFIYNDGDAYGVMDFDGNIVIRARYANLIFANDGDLLFAKSNKDNSQYQLMDLKENPVGREEFANVLPFINGKAIVQESADNWILIDEKGVDQKLKQDIYSISASAFGDEVLVSEYIDYGSISNALKLTKDGILDMSLAMDAEHIAGIIGSIEESGEIGGKEIVADASKYVNVTETNGHFVVNGIPISVSANFDDQMAVSSEGAAPVFNKITPNQIGIQIPASGMLRGKSGAMARDLIGRVQAFGQTVKENNNAAIVKVGDASYFIANSGDGVYVVYGLLDISQIDIEQYKNIVDKSTEPVKRFEVENVFDVIESQIDDVYEIGGAFDKELDEMVSGTGDNDFDSWLGKYEEYVTQYLNYLSKAKEGDSDAISEMAGLLKSAQDLGNQAEQNKTKFSASQLQRYQDITNRLLKGLAESN